MSADEDRIIEALQLLQLGDGFISNLPPQRRKKFYREWAKRVKREINTLLPHNPFKGKAKTKDEPFYLKSPSDNKKVSFFGGPVNVGLDPEYSGVIPNIDYKPFPAGVKRPKVNIDGKWVTLKQYRANVHEMPGVEDSERFSRFWAVRTKTYHYGTVWGVRKTDNKIDYVTSDSSLSSWMYSEYADTIIKYMHDVFDELASEVLAEV